MTMHLCDECGEVHENDARHFVTIVETLLPLDPICPHCKREHDIGQTFSGRSHDCANCGALLQAADDGEQMWTFVEKYPAQKPVTGRQRTRRLWRKRGRR